jgi:hypothetical protein
MYIYKPKPIVSPSKRNLFQITYITIFTQLNHVRSPSLLVKSSEIPSSSWIILKSTNWNLSSEQTAGTWDLLLFHQHFG